MSVNEKHFTCKQIGAFWSLHAETVRPMFENEPGVIKIAHKATRTKRAYVSVRIPQSVMQRVYQKLAA